MATEHLFFVKLKPTPQGSPDFETTRAALLQSFMDKIPSEYRLSQKLLANPPNDVSGIPASCGILSAEEREITETYDAVGLAEAIANRKFTALAVVMAYLKRSIIAHQLTCCLTQWLADDAIEQAKRLDNYMVENGKTIGPLHGVPISIKDHIPIAGTFSSQGCLSSMVKDDEDCQMVAILRRMGAVFYCKTNQPQTLMHLETALIAMRGSVLGIGTDIGGSIRAPSAFCGIYGFKPTSCVLPMEGFLKTPFAAELNVLCSTGPMCLSMRDMDMFMGLMSDTKPYLTDPSLVPIPWTGLQTSFGRRLKVGIIRNDGFIEPQPPVKRAVSWVHDLLADSKYSNAWRKIQRFYWPDGGSLTKSSILASGEPLHPLSEWTWKDAEPAGMQTAETLIHYRRTRDDFRCAFAQDWQKQDVDVVIGPAFVGPACAHDTAFYWTYTSLYNLVDYPAVVIPTQLRVQPGEQYGFSYVPLSESCQHVKQLWESSEFEAAPLALQVVGRRYHDSELFGALAILKDILGLR
ncbi:amidase signature domain-containing protein [Aspergillus caelatus]|uniref:Amidase signature domain-containing protein n=1 Tax=Aspergillus caelatus TaxID=61420 RepID=A0A5N6ZKH0_9EURO|nr:amidase signature domain-containing protein [Aspergillus caelatus]KAE8357299.1 amidase signature domain-containing protein [Aspergillus caelatus]